MARFVFVFITILLLLCIIWESQADAVSQANDQSLTAYPYGSRQGSLKPSECSPKCSSRCSATAYKKPCLFFCNKCCAKCLCVPPGTYGNKQLCPCYNNWKTKRGGPKCP
ncbi:hypothetical protein SUGI_0788540 [Cryptomeria japonica]|uniref:gibberellin-regulated protein 5 n=1 Tax=Cryptomeria japonica TaxID=3369 RepID=UPI0024149D86|nr:gibberellin-regulated protein 5 [Cryptomeria japonica]GLJ38684.1 hypothetical protein SUGI_0788540 [Cryptomeria japonica]